MIADLYSISNRGDASILIGMIELLRFVDPGIEVTVLTDYPALAVFLPELGVAFERQPMADQRSIGLRNLLVFLRNLLLLILAKRGHGFAERRLPAAFREYLRTDVVLSKGGGFLNDNIRPYGRLLNLLLARIAGARVYVFGQSVGPLLRPTLRLLTRGVLSRIDGVFLRERLSCGEMERLSLRNYRVSTDAAFYLSPKAPGSRTRGLLRIDGSQQEFRVSISVRDWSHYREPGRRGQYVDIMARVCAELTGKHGARVYFVSTCTGLGGYHNDDRVIAGQIWDRADRPEGVIRIDDELTPNQLVEVYSLMAVHIGTRMHSNILSLLGGTPVVAVNYEHKTRGIMQLLGLEQFVVDIDEFSSDDITSRVETIRRQSSRLRQHIRQQVRDQRAVLERSILSIFSEEKVPQQCK